MEHLKVVPGDPWPCTQILDLGWKGLPGTNTLDYLATSSATKKSFITLATGVFSILLSFCVTLLQLIDSLSKNVLLQGPMQ
jgi:hypothetical protein